MIRFFNKPISKTMCVTKALSQVTGLANTMAQQVLDRIGISKTVKVGNLSRNQLNQLTSRIYQDYEIEQDLRLTRKRNVARLSSISCYRGYRHSQGLPCRGQRTHGNAKSCRKLKTRF